MNATAQIREARTGNGWTRAELASSVKDTNGDSPLSGGSWHPRDSDVLKLLLYGDVPESR